MGIEHRLHARCAGICGNHDRHEHVFEHGGAGGRPFAFASSPRHFERARHFTIEHIALDLTLDFESRSVRGSATLRLRRVDPEATSIELDAVGFTITAVSIGGKEARYTYDGAKLVVPIALGNERAFRTRSGTSASLLLQRQAMTKPATKATPQRGRRRRRTCSRSMLAGQ